jgi:hypothetical protein
MNDLQLDIKAFRKIRIGIGIISILGGVIFFVYNVRDFNILALTISILWILLGLQNLTNDFGANKILVNTNDTGLEIRWAGFRRYRIIKPEQIENISFNRYYITINHKNERPIMLGLRNFEVSQKTMAYDYFSEIAKRYHIELIRN